MESTVSRTIKAFFFFILTYSSVLYAATIDVLDTSYDAQQQIQAEVSGVSGDKDWVGIFSAGAGSNAANLIKWVRVNADGNVTIGGVVDGSYDLRLFAHNNYIVVAVDSFTVGDVDGTLISKINYGTGQSNTNTWTQGGVSAIYLAAEDSVIIHLSGTQATACTNNGNNSFYTIRAGQNFVTSTSLKSMHATALTAMALNLPITFNYDETTSGCYVSSLALYKQ